MARVRTDQLLTLSETLPHAVSLAVECPEEPYDGTCDRATWTLPRAKQLHGQWDIPGGAVEAGESPAGAAARECVEEAGILTTVGAEVAHYENKETEGRPLVFHTLTSLLRPVSRALDVVLSVDEHDDFR